MTVTDSTRYLACGFVNDKGILAMIKPTATAPSAGRRRLFSRHLLQAPAPTATASQGSMSGNFATSAPGHLLTCCLATSSSKAYYTITSTSHCVSKEVLGGVGTATPETRPVTPTTAQPPGKLLPFLDLSSMS